MNGRFVVLPLRSRILLRSIGYGTAWGAGIGAIVVAVPVGITPFAPAVLIVAVFAAAVGAIVGAACGLTGGLGLVIFRRPAGTSRSAIRMVAGIGAGLPPATCMVALMISTGQPWRPVLALLTVVVVAMAAAIGPHAFYGRPPRRKRRTRHPSSVRRES